MSNKSLKSCQILEPTWPIFAGPVTYWYLWIYTSIYGYHCLSDIYAGWKIHILVLVLCMTYSLYAFAGNLIFIAFMWSNIKQNDKLKLMWNCSIGCRASILVCEGVTSAPYSSKGVATTPFDYMGCWHSTLQL